MYDSCKRKTMPHFQSQFFASSPERCYFFPFSKSFFFWFTLFTRIGFVAAETKSLYVFGSLGKEYFGEVAQFGNPLQNRLSANLMLPPDNAWLCEYPESLVNISSTDLETLPQFQFQRDVALFVSINRCSAETKARVVAEMQQRISSRIKLLILYSTDPAEFKFISLASDDGDNPEDLRNVGILYIPHNYAAGIDLRMRLEYEGDDPRLAREGSEFWSFPIEVSQISSRSPSRSQSEPEYSDDIYWLRVILFSLLIASPCCRACYLWYAGGGRLHWRRDENNRIIGIQYIPPMPMWLSTRGPGHDGPRTTNVLTEDEFNNLPSIIYSGEPEKETDTDDDDDDDVDDDEEEDEEQGAGETKKETREHSSSSSSVAFNAHGASNPILKPDITVDEPPRSDDAAMSDQAKKIKETDEITGAVADIKEEDSDYTSANRPLSDSVEQGLTTTMVMDDTQRDDETDSLPLKSQTAELDLLEEGFSRDSTDNPLYNVSLPISSSIDSEEFSHTGEGRSALEGGDDDIESRRSTNDEESQEKDENWTPSTSCAICIDEFEPGERLTLLPRCRHAFHRDCIHAWLIERQGCCPMCKTAVMAQQRSSSASDEHSNHQSGIDLESPEAQSPESGSGEPDVEAPPESARRRRRHMRHQIDAFS